MVRPIPRARGVPITLLAFSAGLLLLEIQASRAASVTVAFERITSNNAENVEGQLKATVYDYLEANSTYGSGGTNQIANLLSNQILITLTNNVGVASSISEFYIDDDTVLDNKDVVVTPGTVLSSQYQIYNSLGGFTDFSGPGANPDNLPSGNTVSPAFEATTIFSVDAQGNPDLGVDAKADIVGIAFTLITGKDFDDVEDALNDGTIRFGMHLRSIGAAEDSDSFVNSPPSGTSSVVPLPSAAWAGMALLGVMGGVHVFRRRRAA